MKPARIPKGSLGYMCSSDFRDPQTLLKHASMAARVGFKALWASDHFHPWSHTNATEYNAWIWMTSAMAEIKGLPFGTAVTAPIIRYHPAVVAQAFATMERIYGPRVILGVGTGEAMNEVPLGLPWPSLRERRERVVEAIRLMKRLFTEEFVDFNGKYYTLKKANLYMKATVPIYVAGFGPKIAKATGRFADGFITVIRDVEDAKRVLFPAIKEGAEMAGKSLDDITKVIELDISYDQDYDKALKPMRFWAATLVPEVFIRPIGDSREIEALGKRVSDKTLGEVYAVGTTPEFFVKRIEELFRAGFDHVYINSSSPDQEETLRMFSKHVLPHFPGNEA